MLLLLPARARAAPPSTEDLVALGEAVRGSDAATRAEAIDTLSALGEDALPALTARVAALRRERRLGEDGYRALGDFGRAAGAAAPSAAVDLAPGIRAVLDAGASSVHGRAAERWLLLRALERIGTARAIIAMLPILTTDMIAFRWEARHMVRRVGRVAAAALVRAAQSPLAEVDLFAGWGFGELGILDAGHAVQDQTAESLAEILRAYAEVKHLGAMPTVASFVGDDRALVREAAHDGMIHYAENGIWQLRALHASRLGRPAPTGATFRELLARVEAHAEERRTAPFRARMARATEAFEAGRLDEAARLASDVEARAPAMAELTRLAPIHAAAAQRALDAGDLERARAGFRRALLLDPSAADASVWTARVAEIDGAHLARAGIAPWPDSPVAVAVAARETPAPRRWPFMLAGIGVLLLGWPRLARRVAPLGRRARTSPRTALAAARTSFARLGALTQTLHACVLRRARVQAPVTVPRAPGAAPDDDMLDADAPLLSEVQTTASPEEVHVDRSPESSTSSSVPPPEVAVAARSRLEEAAARARARLGAPPSVPPPARPSEVFVVTGVAVPEGLSLLPPDVVPVVETEADTARRAHHAEARGAAEAGARTSDTQAAAAQAAEDEADRALEAEIARAIEEELARAVEGERASAAPRASTSEPAAPEGVPRRQPRPARRAALDPSLLLGQSARAGRRRIG